MNGAVSCKHLLNGTNENHYFEFKTAYHCMGKAAKP
jgi:hypothetical protein